MPRTVTTGAQRWGPGYPISRPPRSQEAAAGIRSECLLLADRLNLQEPPPQPVHLIALALFGSFKPLTDRSDDQSKHLYHDIDVLPHADDCTDRYLNCWLARPKLVTEGRN
jgi:hypothetical protein